MGFFSSIKNGIAELFNPTKKVKINNESQVEAAKTDSDAKIKVAEIERDSKLKLAQMEQEHKAELAGMEKERVEEWRAAQLEIIQAQALAQMAVEEARTKGMTTAANHIFALQEKMTELAEKRMEIIEKCSLPIVREIEDFYDEIGNKISAEDNEYNTKKLPALLDMLEQFKEGTPRYKFYMKRIEDNMEEHHQFILGEMKSVRERQNIVLQGFIASRETILVQTGQITQQIAAGYLKQQENLLPQGQTSPIALPASETKQLPPAESR